MRSVAAAWACRIIRTNDTVGIGQTGDPGWSIGDNYAARSVTNGTPGAWIDFKSDTPLQFAVNASPVPEPSSVALLAGGFGAWVCCLRRRGRMAA